MNNIIEKINQELLNVPTTDKMRLLRTSDVRKISLNIYSSITDKGLWMDAERIIRKTAKYCL